MMFLVVLAMLFGSASVFSSCLFVRKCECVFQLACVDCVQQQRKLLCRDAPIYLMWRSVCLGVLIVWVLFLVTSVSPGLHSIRGRILRGVVVSTKMKRTIIVRRPYFHYVPKYNRYEKRHKNFAVHSSPAFVVHEGDQVVFGQCR